MKKVLSATIGLLAISAVPAAAADLPVKARPMVPVVTAYNWTGCYIGGNVGGKWARTSGPPMSQGPRSAWPQRRARHGADRPRGLAPAFIAGGQVGCNYQPVGSNWVFGIEGDFDWHRLSRTTALVGRAAVPVRRRRHLRLAQRLASFGPRPHRLRFRSRDDLRNRRRRVHERDGRIELHRFDNRRHQLPGSGRFRRARRSRAGRSAAASNMPSSTTGASASKAGTAGTARTGSAGRRSRPSSPRPTAARSRSPRRRSP